MKRALLVIALLLGACGGGKAATPDQTLDIEMRDIAYSPTSVTVKAGTLVEFRFHNKGKVIHDAFIGDAAAQRAHEKSMGDDEGMHHHGGDSSAVMVKPGKTATLRHTFSADDDGILIGCHEPGHYGAGMRVTINVT